MLLGLCNDIINEFAIHLVAILSGKSEVKRMGRCCCAVGCANRYSKSAGIPYYRFPTDPERKHLWVAAVVAILSGKSEVKRMGRCCCAVGCANRYSKSAGIPYYRFPTDPERKHLWVAAVVRKD